MRPFKYIFTFHCPFLALFRSIPVLLIPNLAFFLQILFSSVPGKGGVRGRRCGWGGFGDEDVSTKKTIAKAPLWNFFIALGREIEMWYDMV